MSGNYKEASLFSQTPNSRSFDRRTCYDTTSEKRMAITKTTLKNESEESIMSKISKIESYYKSKLGILNERINDLHNENKVLSEENQKLQGELNTTRQASKNTKHSNDLESLLDDSNIFEKRESGKIKRDYRVQKLELELNQSRERERDLIAQLNDLKLKFKSALNLQSLILAIDLEKNQKLCLNGNAKLRQIRYSSVRKVRNSEFERDNTKEISKVRSELKEMKKDNLQMRDFLQRMSNMNSKKKEDTPVEVKKFNFNRKSFGKEESQLPVFQFQRQETFAPDSGKRELEQFQKNMSNFRNLLQIEENANLLNEQEIEGLQKQLGF